MSFRYMTRKEKLKAYNEALLKAKAEAYDKALSIARETYQSQPVYRDWLEKMFPELKEESEDEKIRKWIIDDIRFNMNNEPLYNSEYRKKAEKAIAWLKKQGEQKPTKWNEEEECYIRQLESMVKERWALAERAQDEEVIKSMSDLAFFLKTLNPNKKSTNEEMKILLRTEYEKGRADAIAEKEWSEEDEKTYDSILNDLRQNVIPDEEDICWFKTLKNRVHPQQEWTEEDSYYRNHIIQIIEEIKNAPLKRREDWDAYINWLKSLRPQNNITDEELAQAKKNAYNDALDKIEYHSGEPTFDDGWSAAIDYIRKKSLRFQNYWKPSDEQMIALRQALSGCPFDIEMLLEVEEQLKKLKEE